MVPTLSSLAPEDVAMTKHSSATRDNNVDIVTTAGFQCTMGHRSDVYVIFLMYLSNMGIMWYWMCLYLFMTSNSIQINIFVQSQPFPPWVHLHQYPLKSLYQCFCPPTSDGISWIFTKDKESLFVISELEYFITFGELIQLGIHVVPFSCAIAISHPMLSLAFEITSRLHIRNVEMHPHGVP